MVAGFYFFMVRCCQANRTVSGAMQLQRRWRPEELKLARVIWRKFWFTNDAQKERTLLFALIFLCCNKSSW